MTYVAVFVTIMNTVITIVEKETIFFHITKHLENLQKKNKMASGAQKYKVAVFILASDSESNDVFGDESTLESSDGYDSEEEPCFPGMEVDETQENDQLTSRCVSKKTFFLIHVRPMMLALYSE